MLQRQAYTLFDKLMLQRHSIIMPSPKAIAFRVQPNKIAKKNHRATIYQSVVFQKQSQRKLVRTIHEDLARVLAHTTPVSKPAASWSLDSPKRLFTADVNSRSNVLVRCTLRFASSSLRCSSECVSRRTCSERMDRSVRTWRWQAAQQTRGQMMQLIFRGDLFNSRFISVYKHEISCKQYWKLEHRQYNFHCTLKPSIQFGLKRIPRALRMAFALNLSCRRRCDCL